MNNKNPSRWFVRWLVFAGAGLALSACGGGGGGRSNPAGQDPTPQPCSGNCADTSALLTVADVQGVIARAVAEARARNVRATIAVVDRVGNVLGIWQMERQTVNISTRLDSSGRPLVNAGLEGINLDIGTADTSSAVAKAAAVAKAVTGAYLSSEGNAFTTRTANQIVQENFNPGERDQPAGPLFGVQFSQLPCSDFSGRFAGGAADAGPKRSPLGLSADPGGLPLYKSGTVVGGVGVIADGRYSIDPVISDFDSDVDELIAIAGQFSFGAPEDRRANRITVDGKTFRYTDVDADDLSANPRNAPAFGTLTATDGGLTALAGYNTATIVQGTPFGTEASGIRADTEGNFPNRDAFVFVNNNNQPRFAPRAGTDAALIGGGALTANEVRTVLSEALAIANRSRAQIRRPLNSQMRVTISVIDTTGVILGMARTRDAPVFGADVSLQKARAAAFFSAVNSGNFVANLPDAAYFGVNRTQNLAAYVTALRTFTGRNGLLADGQVAFANRSVGNLARPFYPDGINGSEPGPLSKGPGEWSVLSSGFQLDLSVNAVLNHVLFLLGATTDVPQNCAGVGIAAGPSVIASTVTELRTANGIQIFPGAVPIYRNSILVGAIGVSGDGIDQDDMVAFLGLHNAGQALGGAIGNAPAAMRADRLTPKGVRLRYVQCPQAPFLDSNDTNVCEGK
ncbi:MAG: heme-binding protein [Gammaproteobacteria bacterium]|nr:heme-binding protein [Gammaproteobacteria bacterium]